MCHYREQLIVLKANGCVTSLNPNDTPMIMINDIASSIWSQLETMVKKREVNIQTQSGDQPKRRRKD